MKSPFLHSLSILAGLWLAAPLAAAEHTRDSLEQVQQNLIKKKAVLIDVREQREWDDGHLRDARLVPLSKLQAIDTDKARAEQLTKELPRDKVIYCHCRSGGRVLPAGDILKKLGYDVRPLKAGYQDLLEAGFPKAP